MTDTRIADSVYTGYSQTKFGAMQAVIGLKCPYCETVTEAYAWSLAGVGKKCDCGAKFIRSNYGYWAEKTND